MGWTEGGGFSPPAPQSVWGPCRQTALPGNFHEGRRDSSVKHRACGCKQGREIPASFPYSWKSRRQQPRWMDPTRLLIRGAPDCLLSPSTSSCVSSTGEELWPNACPPPQKTPRGNNLFFKCLLLKCSERSGVDGSTAGRLKDGGAPCTHLKKSPSC